MSTEQTWQQRMDDLWERFDDIPRDDFVAAVHALAAERPDGDAVAAYWVGSAYDSADHEARAAVAYEAAFAAGLPDDLRRQAVIQYASTLRNLGRAAQGAALLRTERAAASDELDDAVAAFLALTLVDSGREREAVGVALAALTPHLTRYRRSLAAYAQTLVEEP